MVFHCEKDSEDERERERERERDLTEHLATAHQHNKVIPNFVAIIGFPLRGRQRGRKKEREIERERKNERKRESRTYLTTTYHSFSTARKKVREGEKERERMREKERTQLILSRHTVAFPRQERK